MPKLPDLKELTQNERMLQYCKRLRAQNESLIKENAALRGQLEAAESETERLIAIVDADAADLQQFGEHWFKPSSVVSITRDNSVGIMINGNPIGWGEPGKRDSMSLRMEEIALEVNRQNAEKRNRARRK